MCSRWGKSFAEIDEIPAEEFIYHKTFFDKFRWGMESDLLAMLFGQVLGQRTGTVSKVEQSEWKDLAFIKSGTVQKTRTSINDMRSAFMLMAHTIGTEVTDGINK